MKLYGFLLGAILALMDVFNMSVLKEISLGAAKMSWMILPTILYALEPWIFVAGLKTISMTVLNLSWDLLSDIFVTMAGLFYFKENISSLKMFGVGFAFVAIGLFAADGLTSP